MRTPVAAYGLSLAAVAAAVGVRLLLDPLLSDRLPFITLFPAVVFAAWCGGRGPALLSLIVGAVAAAFFLLQPRYSFAIGQVEYQVGLILYGVVGLCSVATFESLRKAQRRAEEKQRQLEEEIAARRAAERVLADREELLRITFASIGDAVITTDARGNVTYLNAVAEELTGWSHSDAQGKPLTAVFQIVNEHTRQAVESPVEKAMREGRAVGLANHTVLIRKDGTERSIDDSAAPIRDDQGRIIGVVLIFRDVTAPREAERGREELLARFETLIQNAPVGIAIFDLDLRFIDLNDRAASVDGLPKDAHLGKTVPDVLPELGPKVEAFLRRVRDSGEPILGVEVAGETPAAKGEQRHWLANYYPVRTDVGRVLGIGAVALDITDLKNAQQALHEADRRKDEFLATLAHELRNPLAPIRNAVQVIRLSPDRVAREQARTMLERQLEQLVRLVDDLLDVSRIRSGKLELRKERMSLSAVVSHAVETSRPLIEHMGHELTVTLPDQPIIVDADPVRLSQVFLNLLNNAAKYTEQGGRITLEVERQGSDVVVSVRDTGIGIAADQLPRLFQMFSQVGGALEKSQGGLGIGLSLVKSLVEIHGGRIEANSDGPGKGSEFVVRLPVVVEASGPLAPAGKDVAAAPKSSLRILVVDDNRDGADSLAMMLKIMGNDTRTAFDGQEAVQVADDFRPDVILLDIGLPRMNGYEACRRIREQSWAKIAILIAVTGWGQEEDRQRSHEAGFDHHMVKPVDPDALMRLLAGLSEAAKR